MKGALALLSSACGTDVAGSQAGFGDVESGHAATEDGGETDAATSGASTGSGDGESSSTGDAVIFDVGAGTGGVEQCDCGAKLDFSYIWVANSPQSTISKINTTTLIEEGRYLTRIDGQGNPSRTSVSLSGTAVAVANRYGGVTKVWADPSLCDPMQNGVPGVQTSSGPNDVLPWGEDDCIAWSTDFDYTTQRPIAWMAGSLDPATCGYENERLWTSGCNKFTDENIFVHRLDGDTGAVLDTISVEGFACYGLGGYGGAVDRDGNFWITNLEIPSSLARVDAQTLDTQVWTAPVGAYGVTVDHEGRPWIACNSGGSPAQCSAARFDPITETWDLADDHIIKSQSGIVQDASGRMWMNWWWYDDQYAAGIAPIDVETLAVGDPIELPAGAKGIAVDLDGFVWSVAGTTDSAYRVDPQSGTFDVVGGLEHPYTYSDMTGWALQNVACDPAG